MEGHWEGGAGAPLILFAWPDMEAEENHFEIGIPYLSSLILTHELEGKVPGLKQFAPQDRPYVPIVFWTFRIMVGIGFLMLFVGGLRLPDMARATVRGALVPVDHRRHDADRVRGDHGRLVHDRDRAAAWMVQGLVRTADGVTPSSTAAGR